MGKLLLKLWVPGLLAWVGLGAVGPSEGAAQYRVATGGGPRTAAVGVKPSMTESISSSFKKSIDRFTEMVTPKTPVRPAEDPVSLRSRARPGAELYVRVARLYEQTGKVKEAAEQYQKALRHTPNYLGALLGYARLKDRLGEPAEATKLYHQAVKTHPKEGSAYNNLALFYARHGMLKESAAALGRAIQLQPRNPKYRNNMATVLVEMGRPAEAFSHLQVVHSEAVAYYNLGYLLEKKGKPQAAVQHFAIALRKNPSLIHARRGLQRLAGTRMQAQAPAGRPEAGTRVGSRSPRPTGQIRSPAPAPGTRPPGARQLPAAPNNSRSGSGHPEPGVRDARPYRGPPMPPERSSPRRLPPLTGPPAAGPMVAPLPMGSYHRRAISVAPLPPEGTRAPAFQPLPRGN